MPMSTERAEQIRQIVWASMQGVENSTHAKITPKEDREIREFWETIDGVNTYYDTVTRMVDGEHLRVRHGTRVQFDFLEERLSAFKDPNARPVDAVTRSISRRLGQPVTLLSDPGRCTEYEDFWVQWYSPTTEVFREEKVRIYR